jgi:hypothetical protein
MSDQQILVSSDGLTRLQSAIFDFARVEVASITQAVIGDLCSRPATGIFEEVMARHLWDEFCWELQEGPFDADMSLGGLRIGSLSGSFDDLLQASIIRCIERVAPYSKVLLSSLAFEEDDDSNEAHSLGNVWIDGIANLIIGQLNGRASQRNLSLIGPDRVDAIGYEISGSGVVWSVLSDRDEAMGLISLYADALIKPDGDLSELVDAMVDAFMATANENAEEAVCDLLGSFGEQVRSMLRDNDIIPSLHAMRASLLLQLDQ